MVTVATRTGKIAARRPGGRGPSAIATFIFLVLTALAVALAIVLDEREVSDGVILAVISPLILLALYVLVALRVANQWEKAVVLRLGKFMGLRGPGMFWIIPVLDSIPMWIDHRVMVTPFNAEKTLTRDTVPIDVDAVLFLSLIHI